MLKQIVYGLVIEYPNHTMLLEEPDLSIINNFEKALKTINNIKTKGLVLIRTDKQFTYLAIYNNPDLKQKTHMYFVNIKERKPFKNIHHKYIDTLGINPTAITDKIEAFAKEKYFCPDRTMEDYFLRISIENLKNRDKLIKIKESNMKSLINLITKSTLSKVLTVVICAGIVTAIAVPIGLNVNKNKETVITSDLEKKDTDAKKTDAKASTKEKTIDKSLLEAAIDPAEVLTKIFGDGTVVKTDKNGLLVYTDENGNYIRYTDSNGNYYYVDADGTLNAVDSLGKLKVADLVDINGYKTSIDATAVGETSNGNVANTNNNSDGNTNNTSGQTSGYVGLSREEEFKHSGDASVSLGYGHYQSSEPWQEYFRAQGYTDFKVVDGTQGYAYMPPKYELIYRNGEIKQVSEEEYNSYINNPNAYPEVLTADAEYLGDNGWCRVCGSGDNWYTWS